MRRNVTQLSLVATVLAISLLLIGITFVYGQGNPPEAASIKQSADGAGSPLGTEFTYQGELADAGQPADGIYDFSFRLLDGPDSGTATQVGSTVNAANVTVADGIFTVALDFGAGIFAGAARWLEISVARDGNGLTLLVPNQPLTAVPYALYGEDADADPTNEFNTGINMTGTSLQITDANGTLSQNIGTFNGNLLVTTNGRLGVRALTPITDMQIEQSDGLIGGTGGLTFSRSTNWKIMHTGTHFSFVENNVRRAYVEAGTGNYVITSDEALKTDVVAMGPVLAGVMALEPVRYHYLDQTAGAPLNYGFLAQDVAAIFPDLARTAEDGTMGLAYADFGVLAIASIQEQQTQIEALQSENEQLRAELDEIKLMLGQQNVNAGGPLPAGYGGMATVPAGDLSARALLSWSNLGFLGMLLVGLWQYGQRRRQERL